LPFISIALPAAVLGGFVVQGFLFLETVAQELGIAKNLGNGVKAKKKKT
jgi:hypothetical protein